MKDGIYMARSKRLVDGMQELSDSVQRTDDYNMAMFGKPFVAKVVDDRVVSGIWLSREGLYSSREIAFCTLRSHRRSGHMTNLLDWLMRWVVEEECKGRKCGVCAEAYNEKSASVMRNILFVNEWCCPEEVFTYGWHPDETLHCHDTFDEYRRDTYPFMFEKGKS